MAWGPWIQDPDITVQAGRARTVGDSGASLGPVSFTGAYTVSDVNNDVQAITAAAVAAAMTDNAEGYPYYSAAAPPATTNAAVFADTGTSPVGYRLDGNYLVECLYSVAFPHGWLPPSGMIQLEGDGQPHVVEAHVELIHEQSLETARSPDYAAPASLEVYKHTATFDGHVVPGTQVFLGSDALSWVDTGPAPTFSTVVDLAGAELDAGVVFTPFVRIEPGAWAYSSDFFDDEFLRQQVVTDVDLPNSYYVWRPPRYRFFIPGVPARRIYPRTDSVGPGLGRNYPPPNTPQSGVRFGSSSPL